MLNKLMAVLLSPFTFKPRFPDHVNHSLLISQAADYFNIPLHEVQEHFQSYQKLHVDKDYERTLGERKTLSFEEAFLIYLAVLRLRPSHVVEIGTQYGKSTRRILDILDQLDLTSTVTCLDVVDELKYVSHQEINLILHDVTNNFLETILAQYSPGVIYLDAHPYKLLDNVIAQFIEWSQTHPAILAIHDCGIGLFNPHMRIPKDDPIAITSKTGHWERHVLTEIFSAPNQDLEDYSTPTHRLRIFSTTHGLALLAPISILIREKRLE